MEQQYKKHNDQFYTVYSDVGLLEAAEDYRCACPNRQWLELKVIDRGLPEIYPSVVHFDYDDEYNLPTISYLPDSFVVEGNDSKKTKLEITSKGILLNKPISLEKGKPWNAHRYEIVVRLAKAHIAIVGGGLYPDVDTVIPRTFDACLTSPRSNEMLEGLLARANRCVDGIVHQE
jgi:hypothetical protein